MIDEVRLVNFKSAQDLYIPLKSLTVLSGLNGSGKSTVLQSLGLLRQSFEESLSKNVQASVLKLRGPLVKIGSAVDLLCEYATSNKLQISLRQKGVWGSVVSTALDLSQYEVGVHFIDSTEPFDFIRGCHFQYLQADRLTPNTHYDRSDSVKSSTIGFLGARGEYTPDYIASHGDRIEVSERRRYLVSGVGIHQELASRIVGTPKLSDQISGWMQLLSPGVRISASLLDATDLVSLRFQYASSIIGQDSRFRRPGNVGYGLTYSLPIVTALLASPSGSLLLLENPEAHLHPRGQAALGSLIARVAADGVQVVVETHSDHVLNGIRLAVKNKIIPSGDCQICNFVRDAETSTSYIETPLIMPNGELSAWPDGFFDEWDKSLQALIS